MQQSDEQLQQELEAILETVRSPGWALVMAEWQLKHDVALNFAPDNCATSDQWQQCRGELRTLKYILGTEQAVLAAMNSLEEGEPDDAVNPLEQ